MALKVNQGVHELLEVKPKCQIKGVDVEVAAGHSAPAADPGVPVRGLTTHTQTICIFKRLRFKRINFGLHSLLRFSETEAHPGTVP